MKHIKTILTLCLISISLNSFATIRYVAVGGTGTGTSWADASGDLQAMIDASAANDQVWVKVGTYKPSRYPTGAATTGSYAPTTSQQYGFILKNEVKLYGSFAGTETSLSQRTAAVIAGNPSILSGDLNGNDVGFTNMGDNAYTVLFSVKDNSSTLLDGFTISHGNASAALSTGLESSNLYAKHGGGMHLYSSDAIISNCIFVLNKAEDLGAAIYAEYSDNTLNNCTFKANAGSSGIYAFYNCSSSLNDCIFSNNTSEYGGGIWLQATILQANRSVFSENNARIGSAAYITVGSAPKFLDCLFLKNEATGTGTIYISSSSSEITNCTFAENNAASNSGGIVFSTSSGSPKSLDISNSIFWGNKIGGNALAAGADLKTFGTETNVNIKNSSLQLANTLSNYPAASGINFITGNAFAANPLFTNALDANGADNVFGTADDGFSLQDCSPAINAGENTANTSTLDLQKGSRVIATTIDMGAYENTSGNSASITGPSTLCTEEVVTLIGSGTPAETGPWVLSNANATITSTGDITAVSDGDCEVTYTAANGCQSTISIIISTSPTITGPTVVCEGSTIQLTATGTPASTFPWTTSNLDASVSETGEVTGIRGGVDCIITFTTSSGCTETHTVSVKSTPEITGSSFVCSGNTTQLTATEPSASTFPWVSDNGSVTISDVGLISWVSSGLNIITFTSLYGCQTTKEINSYVTLPRIYVDSAATGNNDGSSWTDAFTDLQDALEYPCGDEIWVAKGTYIPSKSPYGNSDFLPYSKSFTLPNGKKIYGGFNGTETELSLRAKGFPSILSGIINPLTPEDKVFHVVLSVKNGENTLLDGFTISNGKADLDHSSLLDGEDIYHSNGGGIYLDSSQIKLNNLIIKDNFGGAGGGGLYMADSSDAEISNSVFTSNSGGEGAGALLRAAKGNIYNTVFSQNSASNGGGVYYYKSKTKLSNLTFFGNDATTEGGGIYISGDLSSTGASNLSIKNSIFTGNTKGDVLDVKGSDIHVNADVIGIENSILQIPSNLFGSLIQPFENNLLGIDPLLNDKSNPAGADGFFGTADDGLGISLCSPAVNAANADGLNISITDLDVKGQQRIYNNLLDMGAYEASPILLSPGNIDIVWSGKIDSSWANPCNWFPEWVPDESNARVLMPNTAVRNPFLSHGGNTTIKVMEIENGIEFTILEGDTLNIRGNPAYDFGVKVAGNMNNHGQLNIESETQNAIDACIYLTSNATPIFVNSGEININSTDMGIGVGAAVLATFNNLSSGRINILGGKGVELKLETDFLQFTNSGTFNYLGTNEVFDPTGFASIFNDGLIEVKSGLGINLGTEHSLINGACGKIIVDAGEFSPGLSASNLGYVKLATNKSINPSSALINKGVIKTANLNGISSNEMVVLTDDCPIFNFAQTASFNPASVIEGIYTAVDTLVKAGEFSLSDTTFYGASILSPGLQTLFAKIKIGDCDDKIVVPFEFDNIVPTGISVDQDDACPGTNVLLSASCLAGFDKYWYTTETGGVILASGELALGAVDNPTETTSYYVSCKNDYCQSSRVPAGTATIVPIPSISLSPIDAFCIGSTITISPTFENESTSPTFEFKIDNVSVQNGTDATYTSAEFNIAQEVQVFMTTQDGCSANSEKITLIVNQASKPEVTSNSPICTGENLTISATSSDDPNVSYQWTGPQGFSENTAAAAILSAKSNQTGPYKLLVTDNLTGCKDSITVAIRVDTLVNKLYVNVAATGANNGSNWDDAYTDLQDAFDHHCDFDTIWIAGGTYYPTRTKEGDANPVDNFFKTFYLNKNVKVLGGFKGNETDIIQRLKDGFPTILEGDFNGDDFVTGTGYDLTFQNTSDNSYQIFLIDGGPGKMHLTNELVIDNITIQNANNIDGGNSGGGMLIEARDASTLILSPVLSNIKFIHNQGVTGGALAIIVNGESLEANPEIINCVFEGNKATHFGGAIYALATNTGFIKPKISNSLFVNNTANSQGGAIYSQTNFGLGFQMQLSNSTFVNNNANGAAAPVRTSSPNIANGAAVYLRTFGGFGLGTSYTNNIMWANTINGIGGDVIETITHNYAHSNFRNNLIEGIINGVAFNSSLGFDIGGNVDSNPFFNDLTDLDGPDDIYGTADDGLNLQQCSPAVDAGLDAVGIPTKDILGNARFDIPNTGSSIIDMGAFERTKAVEISVTNNTPVCVGTTINLNASVVNTDFANGFSWLADNSRIFDTQNIELLNTTYADSGNYVLSITSGNCEFLASTNAKIYEVLTYPLTGERSVYACEASDFKIGLPILESETPLIYRWQYNTGTGFQDLLANGTFVDVSSDTLKINYVNTMIDNSSFRAIISNTCDEVISDTFKLIVYQLPEIQTEPESQIACEGNEVYLEVNADGYNVSYQWEIKNGSVYTALSNSGIYSDVNTNILKIGNLSNAINNSNYRCRIFNQCSSINSADASIQIDPSAVILSQPSNKTVCQNQSIIFSTNAVNSTGGNISFQWQVSINGGVSFSNLSNNDTYKNVSTNSLIISQVGLNLNNAQYRCVLNNYCKTTAANLTVNPVVTITQQPVNASICLGSSTNFTVSATGTGITYKWQINVGGTFTNLIDGGIYQGTNTNTLRLEEATIAEDSKQYRCLITGTSTCDLAPLPSNVVTFNIRATAEAQIILANSPISTGPVTYQASLYVLGINKVTSTSMVEYLAGSAVMLNPGFEASAGAVFSAKILNPCALVGISSEKKIPKELVK
jgi:predicted outer membrane repeat protein